MDGMMLCDELERHFGSVKIIVNDLLMHLTPLNPLFIPVNKHGRQKAQYAELPGKTCKATCRSPRSRPGSARAGTGASCGIARGDPVSSKTRSKAAATSFRSISKGELSSFFTTCPTSAPPWASGQSRNALPARRDVPPARKRFPHPLRKTGAVAAARRREARESMGGTAPGIRI